MDRRHQARVEIVQKLYSLKFSPDTSSDSTDAKVRSILKVTDTINKLIKDSAPKFPIEKISKVDLSILQLAIYEMNYEKKAPPKVIINEAIELAHELGSEKSPGFINAVLGKIFTDYE